MVKKWEPINYTSGPFHNFTTSQDVFDDSASSYSPLQVMIHGIACSCENGCLQLSGGLMYNLKHLDVDNVRQVIYSGKKMVEQQIESIRSIAS